jgi:hypothetical protein
LFDFVRGTAVEKLWSDGRLSKYSPFYCCSDVERFLVVYKFGGIYFDQVGYLKNYEDSVGVREVPNDGWLIVIL